MNRFAQALRRPVRLLNSVLLLAVVLGSTAYIAPSFFGYERYIITGGSMSGTIEKGSIVFEKQVPVEDLAVGDVITYLPPSESGVGTLVTHRISRIGKDEAGTRVLRTKGDANQSADPWKFSLVSGTQPVVSYDVPYLGYAFIFLANPQNRMLVIGIPASVIALMALRDLIRVLRRRNNDEDAPTSDIEQDAVLAPLPTPRLSVVRSDPRLVTAERRSA